MEGSFGFGNELFGTARNTIVLTSVVGQSSNTLIRSSPMVSSSKFPQVPRTSGVIPRHVVWTTTLVVAMAIRADVGGWYSTGAEHTPIGKVLSGQIPNGEDGQDNVGTALDTGIQFAQ
jgi:hypothetical protein